MNARTKVDEATATPVTVISRAEKLNWKIEGRQGIFMEIPLSLLQIDHSYQRDNVILPKVKEIAKTWRWEDCGVLLVASRSDGSYWVYEGQHRFLAAAYRGDIISLPCMVFEMNSIKEEARGFVGVNTNRKNVSAKAVQKAQVIAEDVTSIAVQKMVEADGFKIGDAPSKRVVACIRALKSCWEADSVATQDMWNVMATLSADTGPHNNLVRGFFYLRRQLGTNFTREQMSRLIKIGPKALLDGAMKAQNYHQLSGERIWASGIVKTYNLNLRVNKMAEIAI